VDWYGLLTGAFLEGAQDFIPQIREQILSEVDDSTYVTLSIGGFVLEWQRCIQDAFEKALAPS